MLHCLPCHRRQSRIHLTFTTPVTMWKRAVVCARPKQRAAPGHLRMLHSGTGVTAARWMVCHGSAVVHAQDVLLRAENGVVRELTAELHEAVLAPSEYPVPRGHQERLLGHGSSGAGCAWLTPTSQAGASGGDTASGSAGVCRSTSRQWPWEDKELAAGTQDASGTVVAGWVNGHTKRELLPRSLAFTPQPPYVEDGLLWMPTSAGLEMEHAVATLNRLVERSRRTGERSLLQQAADVAVDTARRLTTSPSAETGTVPPQQMFFELFRARLRGRVGDRPATATDMGATLQALTQEFVDESQADGCFRSGDVTLVVSNGHSLAAVRSVLHPWHDPDPVFFVHAGPLGLEHMVEDGSPVKTLVADTRSGVKDTVVLASSKEALQAMAPGETVHEMAANTVLMVHAPGSGTQPVMAQHNAAALDTTTPGPPGTGGGAGSGKGGRARGPRDLGVELVELEVDFDDMFDSHSESEYGATAHWLTPRQKKRRGPKRPAYHSLNTRRDYPSDYYW